MIHGRFEERTRYSTIGICYTVFMIRGYGDRVAVVTGAANGLGRALAKELAARKCHLALVDTDASELPKVKEELAGTGVVVTHHCADVGSEEALQRVAGTIASAHGTVH